MIELEISPMATKRGLIFFEILFISDPMFLAENTYKENISVPRELLIAY
jgi:hypothetical protein